MDDSDQIILDDIVKEEEEIVSNVEKKELSSNLSCYTLSLRKDDVGDAKQFERFVKNCEGMIRRSPEYRLWTGYIREVLGKQVCSVTGEINSETTVEIHHHPFSLFIITKSIINREIASSKEFCSFDICTKVIETHFENRVGYVPLVSSIHEKFHNNCILIPMEIVNGNWKYFLNTYSSFMEDEDLETISERLKITKDNCGWKPKQDFWYRSTNSE